MTPEEAFQTARDAIDKGMDVVVEVTHPNPVDSTATDPLARVRISAPANLPPDERRIDPDLITSAVEKGQMPASSDLLLE